MDDTLDTTGDTGPTSDANTNYTAAGDSSTSTGTLGGFLNTALGTAGNVLTYLQATNQSAAQKQVAALNAASAANKNKTSLSLANISQRTWIIVGGILAGVVLLIVLMRRK